MNSWLKLRWKVTVSSDIVSRLLLVRTQPFDILPQFFTRTKNLHYIFWGAAIETAFISLRKI